MISNYQGNYSYNATGAILSAPPSMGVYYCGYIGSNGLVALYVGRSENIRERLLEHLRSDYWPGVSLFGFRTCSTWGEMVDLEASEIKRLQPRFNTVGK